LGRCHFINHMHAHCDEQFQAIMLLAQAVLAHKQAKCGVQMQRAQANKLAFENRVLSLKTETQASKAEITKLAQSMQPAGGKGQVSTVQTLGNNGSYLFRDTKNAPL